VTPEQEEAVRRALAAAAHPVDHPEGTDPEGGHRPDPPVPPEVAARLDEVLDGLVAPRLAARRGRWRRAVAVAAAAAVIVVGGAAAVTGGFGSSPGSDTSAGGSADSRSTAGPSSRSGEAPTPSPKTGAEAPRTAREPRALAADPAATPQLHRASLRRDVQRLVTAGRGAVPGRQLAQSGCLTPATLPGEDRLAVRLDGRRASLVLGVPSGGLRTARVYSCTDSRTPVATTRVDRSAP
jgi:hypothetical protein